MKLFACVHDGKHFDLYGIHSSPKKIKINPSDIKYGDVNIQPVFMTVLNENEFQSLIKEKDDNLTLWEQFKIAFIWENPDETFWFDSLTESREETLRWMSESSRNRLMTLGFKVVPVLFSLEKQAENI